MNTELKVDSSWYNKFNLTLIISTSSLLSPISVTLDEKISDLFQYEYQNCACIICVYMYMCVCTCTCVCMYMYMCVYVHVCGSLVHFYCKTKIIISKQFNKFNKTGSSGQQMLTFLNT